MKIILVKKLTNKRNTKAYLLPKCLREINIKSTASMKINDPGHTTLISAKKLHSVIRFKRTFNFCDFASL